MSAYFEFGNFSDSSVILYSLDMHGILGSTLVNE